MNDIERRSQLIARFFKDFAEKHPEAMMKLRENIIYTRLTDREIIEMSTRNGMFIVDSLQALTMHKED